MITFILQSCVRLQTNVNPFGSMSMWMWSYIYLHHILNILWFLFLFFFLILMNWLHIILIFVDRRSAVDRAVKTLGRGAEFGKFGPARENAGEIRERVPPVALTGEVGTEWPGELPRVVPSFCFVVMKRPGRQYLLANLWIAPPPLLPRATSCSVSPFHFFSTLY